MKATHLSAANAEPGAPMLPEAGMNGSPRGHAPADAPASGGAWLLGEPVGHPLLFTH
jgi:hypothetical protein